MMSVSSALAKTRLASEGARARDPPVLESGAEESASPAGGNPELTGHEIRNRIARGTAMLAGREVLLQAIGFVTSLVLARLLAPAYFGVTTLGLTIASAANIIADGGVGAALIQRSEVPSKEELGAVSGLQLSITLPVAAIAVPLGFLLGGYAPETTIVALALPCYSLRTAPLLLFERRLEVIPRILVQLTELLSYAVFAIGLAIAGAGVWAMPVALVLRAAAGTVVARRVSPIRGFRPNLQLHRIRSVLAFGARFQVRTIAQLVRDITLVSVITTFGGFRALGYWGFCYRLFSIAQIVSTALGELSMPAFARLRDAGEQVNELLMRSTSAVTLITALLLAPVVAGSRGLIPFFFGHRWADAALIMPGLAFAMIVAAPLGVTVVSYLYAMGDARTPLRGSVLNGILTVGFVIAGSQVMGLTGIGLGAALSSVLIVPVMLIAVKRRGGPSLFSAFFWPAFGAAIALCAGWRLCWALHASLEGGVAGMVLALLIDVALAWITSRDALVTCGRMFRRTFAMRRRGAADDLDPTPDIG
jgi:O-antigen/teichoic acid export membrane protein